jgi:hypothetical protein
LLNNYKFSAFTFVNVTRLKSDKVTSWRMANLVAKFIALESTFSIASKLMLENFQHQRVDDEMGIEAWDATWYAVNLPVQIKVDGLTDTVIDMRRNISLKFLETVQGTVQGRNKEEVIDICCKLMINNYRKIFDAVNKLCEQHKVANLPDVIKSIEYLLTFSDKSMNKLATMNRRFRLFYFFQVYEIICLNKDIDNETVMKFEQLVDKLGDSLEYKKLFGEIKLENLENILTTAKIDIPRDLIKLIIEYCKFSIHNPSDLDQVTRNLCCAGFVC